MVVITAHKISAQLRRLMADKPGAGAVRGESVYALPESDDSSMVDGLAQIMDQNRMPESAEEIARTCEDLLLKLGDEKLRRTALLRMEGCSNQEIADRLGRSVARTKQRVARIKEIWERVTKL